MRPFVEDLARKIGHPCTVERADVAAYRRVHRLSPEAAAREVRYAFLARVACEAGADAVALAHTRDDQAETVLLHLVRGGGLAGLRGMSVRSTYRGPGGPVALVRPLLDVGWEETEAFCRSRGVTPRQDPTNLLTTIPRNHLRLNVLPQLRQINPQVGAALARLARSAALDVDYMEGQVDQVWRQAVREADGGLLLDCVALNAQHRAVVQHLLRRAYAGVRGSKADLEQVHVEEMARLLLGPTGRKTALPGGVTLEVGPRDAWLSAGRPYPCPVAPAGGGVRAARLRGGDGGRMAGERVGGDLTGRPGRWAVQRIPGPGRVGRGAGVADSPEGGPLSAARRPPGLAEPSGVHPRGKRPQSCRTSW